EIPFNIYTSYLALIGMHPVARQPRRRPLACVPASFGWTRPPAFGYAHRMLTKVRIKAALFSLLAMIGCAPSPKPDAATAAPAAGAEVTTPSGLKYTDLVVGTGASPAQGQIAVVHYTGWLTDGTKFDSSKDRGQP